MIENVEAIYDGTAFRPLQPVPLAPEQRVVLTIQTLEMEDNELADCPWRGGMGLEFPKTQLPLGNLLSLPTNLPHRDLVPNMNFHRMNDGDE